MASEIEWFEKPLGEITNNHDGKRRPVKESERKKGAFPYYGASGVVDQVDGYLFDGSYLLIAEDGENLRTRQTPIAFMAHGKFWVNNHAHIVTGTDEVSTEYLHYFLQVADIQPYLTGAVMPKLTQGNLNRIPVRYPSPSLQREIVKVLKALDDKIDLNRRINQTLEAMAQAIFKSWFVDFDPVKAKISAKAEGRDPLRAAMTAISGKPDAELDTLPPDQFGPLVATAALFPDEMEDSELGPIPAGWIASRIGDVTARVAMGPFGSDIKKDNFVEAGVPVIRGGNLTDGLVEKGYVFLTEAKADELKNANAFPGDIVITHRGTLGQVGLIPARSKFSRYVVSQSQMLLSVDRSRMSPRYLFEFIRSDVGKHLLLSNTSQVGVPAIARPTGSVKSVPLVVPPKAVLDAYDDLLKPILLELTHRTNTTETLAELRDTLLPKLLSGELQVHKADSIA